MEKLKEAIKRYFKKLCSEVHSAVVGIIVGALLLGAGAGGIYLFSKDLWTLLKSIFLSATPLWVTVLFVIVVLAYIYLKSEKQNTSSTAQNKNYEIKFFTIGQYRWETKIYDYGYVEVEKYPYCATHDLKFIFGNRGTYCPGTENERCSNILSNADKFEVYESAKSIIDNKVRNKEY